MDNGEGGVVVSRDWLHTKILDAAQKKHHGKLCGLVLAGGTGAGKVGAVNSRVIILIHNVVWRMCLHWWVFDMIDCDGGGF